MQLEAIVIVVHREIAIMLEYVEDLVNAAVGVFAKNDCT